MIPAMRKIRSLRSSLSLATAAVLTVTAFPVTMQFQDTPPPPLFTAATQQRAEALLAKMTSEEKVGQLTQMFVFMPNAEVDRAHP